MLYGWVITDSSSLNRVRHLYTLSPFSNNAVWVDAVGRSQHVSPFHESVNVICIGSVHEWVTNNDLIVRGLRTVPYYINVVTPRIFEVRTHYIVFE